MKFDLRLVMFNAKDVQTNITAWINYDIKYSFPQFSSFSFFLISTN